jgi:hypothetical protein
MLKTSQDILWRLHVMDEAVIFSIAFNDGSIRDFELLSTLTADNDREYAAMFPRDSVRAGVTGINVFSIQSYMEYEIALKEFEKRVDEADKDDRVL